MMSKDMFKEALPFGRDVIEIECGIYPIYHISHKRYFARMGYAQVQDMTVAVCVRGSRLIEFIRAWQPTFSDDIAAAPSYAWPLILLTGILFSVKTSTILFAIASPVVRFRWRKSMNSIRIYGSLWLSFKNGIHKARTFWFENVSVTSSAMVE